MSDLSLTLYNPKKDIIVASDARNLSFRAVILHRESNGQVKAIAHMSRTFLPAEKMYSQIEKNGFRDNFCGKMFHRFIHGRSFPLQMNHWLLLSIFGSKKGIPTYILHTDFGDEDQYC